MSGAGQAPGHGAWRGALAHRFDRPARRHARERLERALPELDADERRRVVRASFGHRAAARHATRAVERLSDVEVCRRLTVSGWSHLAAAERDAPPVLFLTAALGLPALVHRALTIYRGPLRAIGSTLRGTAAAPDGHEPRLLVVAGAEPCGGPGPLRLLAQASHARRGAVVPAFAASSPGGWRLELEPAIAPATAAGRLEDSEAAYLAVITRRLRSAPATWPWADAEWPPQ